MFKGMFQSHPKEFRTSLTSSFFHHISIKQISLVFSLPGIVYVVTANQSVLQVFKPEYVDYLKCILGLVGRHTFLDF